MKVTKNKHRNKRAHILLTALVMSVTLAIAVGSYAILVTGQNKSISRSLIWNQGMPVAESGIEEALTQLYYKGTNTPGNGWIVTNKTYFKQRSVGTNGNYYIVSIVPSNKPVITATGYALQPLSKTTYLSRTVQVKTAKNPASKGGIVARGAVTFSGNAYLDSFDSSDPNSSTNGFYTSSKHKDNGQIISNSGSISLSGGAIYGYVATGPTGTVTTSGSATVGDAAFVSGGNKGVQTGHSANNANVDFPAVQIPSTGGTYTPNAGKYNGTNYDYLLQNANYYTSSSVKINGAMAIIGDVTLYVNNDFATSGNGSIYMYPGSSLKLYVSGGFNVSGGGIDNSTLDASKLSVYGLNTSPKSWSYSGNATFIGTIYAPNVDFSFSGNSGAVGSFSVNTASVSGNAGIHYDENLSPALKGYTITSWNEI